MLRLGRAKCLVQVSWIGPLALTGRERASHALGGAKDNIEMEAWNSRSEKEGRLLLPEARDLCELRSVLGERIDYCNEERRHSAPGSRRLGPSRHESRPAGDRVNRGGCSGFGMHPPRHVLPLPRTAGGGVT